MRGLFPLLFGLTLLARAQDEPPALPDAGQGYEHIERFIEVLERVRAEHPDAGKLGYERLVNHALEGMLGSLDSFSGFYHPETYSFVGDDLREPTAPGLGITLSKSDDRVKIAAVRDHSPADKGGIAPGDQLLEIDGETCTELPLDRILDLLSGVPGETVTLKLKRKADLHDYEASLLRAVVKQPAIADAFLLDEDAAKKTGYIRLTEFTAPSHRELEAALDELEDKGMKSLILDLRGNPGGILQVSVKIAGEFLPPSTEVVFTRGRNPAHNSPPLTTPERQRKKRDYPLVVLIDRNSASASELVAGALQDLERATIVGETSYGKGSVQNIQPLGNGTALRLTIAKYHTPSGRTPHEVGIEPDRVVEISEDDRALFELWKRRESASPEDREKLAQWSDPVLAAAQKVLAAEDTP